MRRLVAVIAILASHHARADEVADLVARGQELAKHSEYTQAIEAFKQADLRRPRAAHACMIGLAYLRRELWPQAELFLALCEQRAVPGDQPPDWIDEAEHTLAAKLTAAQIPAIKIEVTPSDARLTVSSFAPDESFAPQTIHLAPGKHMIEVTAVGHVTQRREISVKPAEPQTVTFTLERDPALPPPPPPPSKPSPTKRGSSKIPWLIAGGVALTGIAVIFDYAELQPARDRLATVMTASGYDGSYSDFSVKRIATVSLFASGLLAVGAGVVLHYTISKDTDAQITAQVGDHSAAIVVGWRR